MENILNTKCCTMAMIIAVTSILGASAGEKTVISTTASLRDGSTVKGEFCTSEIKGGTLFDNELVLSPSLVKSICFIGTNGESKIELTNGDRFAMTITNESFELRSMLGDLKIPRMNFRTILLSVRYVLVDKVESPDGLVFHCTFDDKEATTCPLIGKTDVKILNATFEAGKFGNAMRVQRGIPAVEIKFPPGTFSKQGCVEFWAKLMDGKTEFSTGGDPRFFTLYTATGGQCGNFEYASNSGNGNKGLCGTIWTGFAATHSGYGHLMPYSDIFHGKPYEDWHHYAISWKMNDDGCSDNVVKFSICVDLFIDGKKVSTVQELGSADDMALKVFGDSILMGIPMNERGPSYNNKSSFLIDDLKIWNNDKTTFGL